MFNNENRSCLALRQLDLDMIPGGRCLRLLRIDGRRIEDIRLVLSRSTTCSARATEPVRLGKLFPCVFRERNLGGTNVLDLHRGRAADVDFAFVLARDDFAADGKLILGEMAVLEPKLH